MSAYIRPSQRALGKVRILDGGMRILAFLLLSFFLPLARAEGLRRLVLEATAYTSSPRETDRTPFITATGMRTALGVVAVSRDLLRILPYGTKLRLKDLGSVYGRGKGRFDALFRGRIFVVADTMHPRMRKRLDIWLPDRTLALQFGRRFLEVEVVAYPR